MPVYLLFFRHSATTERKAVFGTIKESSKRRIAEREVHGVLIGYDTGRDIYYYYCVDDSDDDNDNFG